MDKKKLPRLYTGNYNLSARWFVEYLDEKGKKRKKYGSLNRHKTVQERLAAGRALLLTYQKKSSSKEHLDKSLLMWKELKRHKSLWRESTYIAKKSILNRFLEWMKDREWTPETVHSFFLDYLVTELEYHNRTFNSYRTVLGQIFKWCELEYLLEKVEKRKAISTPARYYTKAQSKYLIEYLKKHDPTLWMYVQFVYYCFIRPRTELLSLKVGDIMLEEQTITIPHVRSKNHKRRTVVIPNVFLEHVRKFIQGRSPSEYLFHNEKDHFKPIGRGTLGRRYRLILEELKFDTTEYKVYSWKHSGCRDAINAGISAKKLQMQTGHHSLDEFDGYVRQMGIEDLGDLKKNFPSLEASNQKQGTISVPKEKLLSLFRDECSMYEWLRS